MYGIIRKIRQFRLPVDCQLDLFDIVVVPVYAEEWGYENLDVIERIHLKFLMHVLNLKTSTQSYMAKQVDSLYIFQYTFELFQTGPNFYQVQIIKLYISCTNICITCTVIDFYQILYIYVYRKFLIQVVHQIYGTNNVTI